LDRFRHKSDSSYQTSETYQSTILLPQSFYLLLTNVQQHGDLVNGVFSTTMASSGDWTCDNTMNTLNFKAWMCLAENLTLFIFSRQIHCYRYTGTVWWI